MYPTNRVLLEACPSPGGCISRQNPCNSRGRGRGARGGAGAQRPQVPPDVLGLLEVHNSGYPVV